MGPFEVERGTDMVLDDFNVEGLSRGGLGLEQGHHISGDKFAFFCYFFLAMTPTSTSFLAMILTSKTACLGTC